MKKFRSDITKIDRSATAQPHRKQAYRALLATSIVAGSQLLGILSAAANPVPNPGIPSPLLPTRVILNGSFEEPKITTWTGTPSVASWPTNPQPALSSTKGSTGDHISAGNIREAYNEQAANPSANPIIWRSTESESNRPNPDPENQCKTVKPNGSRRDSVCFVDAIEVWRGTPGGGSPTATSGAGQQYAELNGSDNATLYQDICVVPGETVKWSLRHSARKLGATDPTNIMQVSITDPTQWTGKIPPASQANAYYSATTSSANTTSTPYMATAFSQGWKQYEGQWTNPNTTSKLMRFGFGAIQGSAGSATIGNFIDDVKLSLPALIDFLPSDPSKGVNVGTHTEGNDPTKPNYYYLSLRINGQMSSKSKVRIQLNGLNSGRSFRLGTVVKGGNVTGTTGLTATTDGNKIMLDIPAEIYNPNNPNDYIHIPIDFSDRVYHKNDKLTFTLDGIEEGNLTAQSTRCSTDILKVEPELKEDDPDVFYKKVERPVRIANH